MSQSKKSALDPSKITGPYPLLAIMVIVFESTFGAWLALSQSSLERIIAGSIMCVIFVVLMVTVTKINGQKVSKQTIPQVLGTAVTPAKQLATKTEITAPPSDLMAGPDGSYTIKIPPVNWSTKILTFKQFVGDTWQINNSSLKDTFVKPYSNIPNVLTITASEFSVIPIPALTTVNERKVPTGLEVKMRNRLSIFPIDRFDPPLYVESTLSQNALTLFSGILKIPSLKIQNINQGTIPESGRKYFSLEASQDLTHMKVNDSIYEKLKNNFLFMVIEGEINDFAVFLTYVSGLDAHPSCDAKIEEVKTLVNLASSIKPLKLPNVSELKAKQVQEATKAFDQIVATQGQKMFLLEWTILIMRLASYDMEKENDRAKAIQIIEPFISLANELKINDAILMRITEAINLARKGNADLLKSEIDLQIALFRSNSEKTDVPLIFS